MKISVLVSLLFLVVLLIIPLSAFAKSEVDISSSSNFSSQVKDFSGGQTIHVRIKYDTDYSTVTLILDDNNSNPLKTVGMTNQGNNTYTGSLTAPGKSNYYLIRIEASEGESKKSTIVRTIKVGETGSASLNVKIDSKANGEKITNGNTTTNITNNASLNTTSDTDEEESDNKVSIIRQEITSQDENNQESKGEIRLIKTILFITNPMLFATFLLLS